MLAVGIMHWLHASHSWLGTEGTFNYMDTGELTVYDPRRCASSWRAYRQPALIHTPEYITAYSASPGACIIFWWHSGRGVRTEFRLRPTLHPIGFLLIATSFTYTGFWNAVFYNVPDILKRRQSIPTSQQRMLHIFSCSSRTDKLLYSQAYGLFHWHGVMRQPAWGYVSIFL